MTPRTAAPGLLALLAASAGIGAISAWLWVDAPPAADRIEPVHATEPSVRASEPVALAALRDTESRTNSLPAALGTVACLEDGHTSISGIVVDSDGVPIAKATVAILGAPHTGDALKVRGSALTDELGRFDVRTERPGDVWLAVVAPGMRPASRGLAIEPGFVDLAQAVRLERGAEITGRVFAGEDPLERVELEALVTRPTQRASIGEHELALVEGRLEWSAPRCTTDAAGRFGFHGLAPGRWLVRPRAFRCPTAVFPPGALAAEPIEAPARDVDLHIPAAKLVVDVLLDGAALAWAEVEVEYRGLRSSRRADARGRLEVDVSPDEGIEVVVRAPGRAPAREVVSGPRRGERREIKVEAGPPAPAKPDPVAPVASGTSFRPGI